MTPSAKVIADSTYEGGTRVTTLECVMHRFVLAEFNTHRVFSRNSASSRAIPVAKQLQRVIDNPAIPLVWPAEKGGMQGGDALDAESAKAAEEFWLRARDTAAHDAKLLADMGVHKSVTNRLLEPFMWHTVVVTSTEWDNFFEQRCSPLAQPEIQAVAYEMRDAIKNSTPRVLAELEFHKPYIDASDYDLIPDGPGPDDIETVLVKMSAARCCRVSREAQGGGRSLEDDMKTYTRLMEPGEGPPHWSPLEHPCRPRTDSDGPQVGNLIGWVQLRHIVSGEAL